MHVILNHKLELRLILLLLCKAMTESKDNVENNGKHMLAAAK